MRASSPFLVWLRSPTTRENAFLLGMSVFTVFTIAASYSKLKDSPGMRQPGTEGSVIGSPQVATGPDQIDWLFFVKSAHARPSHAEGVQAPVAAPESVHPNGTVIWKEVGVSSCKPEYLGPFGLTSLFSNRLRFCKEPYMLKYPQRIEVLECWTSGLRNYRYVHVAYEREGAIKTGWIPDGQIPRVWTAVRMDKDASVPKSCEVLAAPGA